MEGNLGSVESTHMTVLRVNRVDSELTHVSRPAYALHTVTDQYTHMNSHFTADTM
jgi:hypothetical protein